MAHNRIRFRLAALGTMVFFVGFPLRSAFADPLFSNPVLPTGHFPVSIAVGDFDGDGQPDLAVANSSSGHFGVPESVSIMLNAGSGAFHPQKQFPVGVTPFSVVVGDFNEDGRPDLATANLLSDDVSILAGLGNGSFAQERRFGVRGFPSFLAVGDFNEDGHQDLVVLNNFSEDLSLLLGTGDGTFAPQIRFASGNSPYSLATGDFNGDGHSDLAVVYLDSNTLVIFIGHGNGTFSPLASLGAGAGPIAVTAANLDADGRLDLVVTNFYSNDLSVLLGRGDGSFLPQSRFQAGASPVTAHVEDLNGDGRPDLAVANYDSSDVSILLGEGDGTFSQQVRFLAGFNPYDITAADLDGDGDQDLAVAISESNLVSILQGNGDGTFMVPDRFGAGSAPHSVAVTDLDGDEHQDLVVANSQSNDLSLLLGHGDGIFAPDVRLSVGTRPFAVAAADLNGDGIQDLVTTEDSSNDVSVTLGMGNATFGSLVRYAVGMAPHFTLVTDLNTDGMPDLAVVNSDSNDISVLLGLGHGDFQPQVRYSAGSKPASVATGDVNGDGHPDLVTANFGDLSILFGRGDGSFVAGFTLAVEAGPLVAVTVQDFNQDGRPDLAVVSAGIWKLSVFLGHGDGTFEPEVQYAAGYTPNSLVSGDFNADGILDIVAANSLDDFSLYLGTGDGAFSPEIRFGAGRSPACVAIGDFNEDGRSDLVLANRRSNDVSVSLNLGPFPNNFPPIADAGVDQTRECTGSSGAEVVLDGSASKDSDSSPGTHDDIVSFEWFENYGMPTQRDLGLGETLSLVLPLGGYSFTLKVTDSTGKSDTAVVSVTVVDLTPPAISVVVDPSLLWPPNHALAPVTVGGQVQDLCDPNSAVVLVSVTSSEPDDAPGGGDGNTSGDIQGADVESADFNFQLRAERDAGGEGRAYRVTYLAVDSRGNQAQADSLVLVPHDQGGSAEPVLISADAAASGTLLWWDPVPGASTYNVIRGDVGALHESGDFIDLGTVSCIQPVSASTNTQGDEDAEVPPLGEAFFYLVAYDDGRDSGYGTATATKPRMKTGGGCE